MTHIVFLDRKTIAPQINVRRPAFEHNWDEFENTESDKVVERCVNAEIVITNKVKLNAEILAQLPNLKFIAIAATGYDCVDIEYCKNHNITVSNIQGYAINTVPEHTFALILCLRRNLLMYDQQVNDNEWQKSDMFCFFNRPIGDIANKNLVIIGSGVIGNKVANIAKAFGMNVFFCERKSATTIREGYTAWDDCLALADIITIHSPLNEHTKQMIGIIEFEKMLRKPLIINTARGNLVVEEDLEKAIERGLISGAGFDVSIQEPPAENSPLMRLAALPNFILTPHTAWASDEAQQNLADQLIDNIEQFHQGRPQHIIT